VVIVHKCSRCNSFAPTDGELALICFCHAVDQDGQTGRVGILSVLVVLIILVFIFSLIQILT